MADNTPEQKPQAQNKGQQSKKQKKKQQKEVISKAVLERSITLYTLPAQRVMARSYERVKRALFQTDIVLRIVNRSDEEIAEMDKAIAGFIDPVSNSIKQALERMEHIAEGEGGKTAPLDLCTYTNPKVYALKIDSAQLGRVVTLIEQMDRVTILVNTLFMHGMLDAEQNKNFPQEWQRKLNSLCSTLIRIENKAREKAYDEGKGEEVEAAAGKSANPSMGDGIDAVDDDELANLPLGDKPAGDTAKATQGKSTAKKAPAKKAPVKKKAEVAS